jgi:hypothetical protein
MEYANVRMMNVMRESYLYTYSTIKFIGKSYIYEQFADINRAGCKIFF